ncbi:MAG: DEAD/DEAH box helicase [Paracoccaceae bacterium]
MKAASMTDFPNIHPALNAALEAKGYAALTPVQEAVTDPALAGRDLLVSAQTGSGKTVAFGLAMAGELMAEAGGFAFADVPRALIVAPTRELAVQVQRELQWLYGAAGAVIAGAVGGMDARSERRALERGAHIVVGTPGRICDHMRRCALDLSELRVAVLDEADEMLDLGFREDLEFILEAAPETRRTLLFSATVSPGIAKLAGSFQNDAQRISTVSAREQHADIEYRALLVDNSDRENAIVNLLRFYEAQRAIVFCSTRAMVTHLTGKFLNRGFSVVALSGELSQDERSRALQMMRDGRARVCVATDVAARGIDLPGLELVVHADLPQNKEALLHRSGRTGRAGAKGVSALVVPMGARNKAERLLGFAKINATWAAAPGADEIVARDVERLMGDAVLTKPATADEADLIARLTGAYSTEQLAAAVARQYLAGRSAPEDLVAVSVDGAKPRARVEFERASWLRLDIGRQDRADPKWLLPMLCRAGDLSRRDIGMIRIFDDHTIVQIHADATNRFMGAIGPAMQLEDKGAIALLPGQPEGLDAATTRPGRPERKPRPGVKPHRKGQWRDEGDDPRPPRAPAKSWDKPQGKKEKFGAKPWEAKAEAPAPARPRREPAEEGGEFSGKSFKPAGKPGAKYGKPAGKPGAKPAGKFGAKPAGKFGAKPAGKPGAKPFKGKPKGK